MEIEVRSIKSFMKLEIERFIERKRGYLYLLKESNLEVFE